MVSWWTENSAARPGVGIEAHALSGQGVDHCGGLGAELLGLATDALLPVVTTVPLRKRENPYSDCFVPVMPRPYPRTVTLRPRSAFDLFASNNK